MERGGCWGLEEGRGEDEEGVKSAEDDGERSHDGVAGGMKSGNVWSDCGRSTTAT